MHEDKGSTSQHNASPYPIENCPECRQTYWACEQCGASPMGGIHAKEEDKPEKCKNPYCGSKDHLVFKTILVCCRRHWHHSGITCRHCGSRF